MRGIGNNNSEPNFVAQVPGTSIVLEYSGIVGYANDTNTPTVTIPLPFVAKNTNYTVSVNGWNIDGKGVPTNVDVINKRINSFMLKGSITVSYLALCASRVNVTITFA